MSEQDIITQAISILEKRLQKPAHAIESPADTAHYLRLHLSEKEYESFSVMFLDSQHRLLSLKELFKGTINSAPVYPREVVKAVLSFNAAAVILAHNHPSGLATPSNADHRITNRIKSALELIDVKTLDHVVVGHDSAYSFAEHNLI
ncbi:MULTISPECIES: RadC family protein [Pseudoalteromonas]|uniref:MPN domain-containing protein n=1 Tax=Pseudoalteromonas amylolytica TaxID=1859457 RepID=A0A1S1MTB2_9GAMM|nr:MULTISPECIES: DNA repair protein RadC [Pseudoalteromonas]OHU89204.1 hypothetical protein BFC16_06085 [Pseudoalteromonas sp. JW3]OHU92104.1 hypothetical protein BET10_07190 [Pseudoalteromonas amylolytica]